MSHCFPYPPPKKKKIDKLMSDSQGKKKGVQFLWYTLYLHTMRVKGLLLLLLVHTVLVLYPLVSIKVPSGKYCSCA